MFGTYPVFEIRAHYFRGGHFVFMLLRSALDCFLATQREDFVLVLRYTGTNVR